MFRKWLMKGSITLVLLLGILAFSGAPRLHVSAAHAPVTRGDVEAIFHDNFRFFVQIIMHAKTVVMGAPVEDHARAFISPDSGGSASNFCVDDWHLISVGLFNVVDNVFFFTREQAIADLEQTTITLTLDGAQLPVMRTPVTQISVNDQRFIGAPPFFFFVAGSFLSPTALSVGTHTAGLFLNDPAFGTFQDSNTFTVDPSGTGACL